MGYFTHRTALATATAAGLLLAGCGGPVESGHRDDPRFVPANLTAADRQAAAALSLASTTVAQRGDPYATAVGCAAALAVLQDLIRDNGLVGARERQGIDAARTEFTRRTVGLATAADKSEAQAKTEIEQAQATAADDPGSAARNALACINTLAQGA